MTLDGFKLTLPDNTVFEATGNIRVEAEQQANYALSGGGSVLGFASNIFDDIGGQGSAVLKTPLASGHIGAAGGRRVFRVDFSQWEGSSDQWGSASNSDGIQTKMSVLDAEVARAQPDSLSPATLEYGEFYSSGTYDPIPVVIREVDAVIDFSESATSFRPALVCEETIDLSQAVDGSGGADADYRITPAGQSTPRTPIPADTLGPGGRGTGSQRQGNESAPSSLVDTNGSGSDPTTQATSISPSEVRLQGAWRGSEAAQIAQDFRDDFLASDSVDRIDLTAPNRSGPDPLTGTYVITDQSAIDPLTPQVEGGVYGFNLVLREA